MPDLQTLVTDGFLFTETAGEYALLTADFGDGYEAAALIGSAEGLRTWSITISVLPDSTDQGAAAIPDTLDASLLLLEDGGELLTEEGDDFVLERESTRAQYLWRFFRVSKTSGNQPFWIEVDDPEDGERKLFLACFVDSALTYQQLCAKVYATGLHLRQRRIAGVESPIAAE